MPTVVRHIRIEAPIERVWEVLIDVPGQPTWMRDLRDIRFVTPGPPAVGSVFVGTVRMFGLSQADPIEITAVDPPRHYAIRHLGGFRGVGSFDLWSIEGGSTTHVRWHEALVPTPETFPLLPRLSRLPGIGSLVGRAATLLATLVDPLLEPVFRYVFREDLRRLKRFVETGRP